MQESKQDLNSDKFVYNIIRNVALGVTENAAHDIWISGEIDCYCLCKSEKDSDGEMVYTAYQLWISPKIRGLAQVRRLVKFLVFYAQKQGYKRLYIPSSRLDNIKAYSRGLGKDFRIKTITFSKEL